MIPLEDVKDVESFSATVVRRSLAKGMTESEIEEATAEGVALLYELHTAWDPKRCESFYSYCVTYLQLRLIDWWRRDSRQRNLAHRNSGEGSKYIYHGRVSLDELGDVSTAAADGAFTLEERSRSDRALVTADHHRLGE